MDSASQAARGGRQLRGKSGTLHGPVPRDSMDPVFPFSIVLPARGEGARAHELHQQLRAAILDGRLAPGSQLPATRRVATALRIARNTVVTAYDLLVAEGYAIPRVGA